MGLSFVGFLYKNKYSIILTIKVCFFGKFIVKLSKDQFSKSQYAFKSLMVIILLQMIEKI